MRNAWRWCSLQRRAEKAAILGPDDNPDARPNGHLQRSFALVKVAIDHVPNRGLRRANGRLRRDRLVRAMRLHRLGAPDARQLAHEAERRRVDAEHVEGAGLLA